MISPPRSRWRQPLSPSRLDLSLQDRFSPGQRRAVGAVEVVALVLGATAAILRYGLRDLSGALSYELGFVVVVSLGVLLATIVLRDRASLTRDTFRQRHRFRFTLAAIWVTICAAILAIGPELLGLPHGMSRLSAILVWSDMVILFRAGVTAVGTTRGVAAGAFNPALLLIGSFAILITIGTALLMLPRCRSANAAPMPWEKRLLVAAFTSTSASCVTGLTVVPTGGEDAYWSRTGHTVILGLIQVGGLGIMTCGAFFALATSRSLRLRESVTLRELFDPDQPINLRRLVFSILAFTFGCELLGAALLSTLWPDKPPGELMFYSLFHAVSAFCNAGFDLTGHSFVGSGARWQVWGVVAGLIILGGLGFGTLYNLTHTAARRASRARGQRFTWLIGLGDDVAPSRRARLTVTTRLVLATTFVLLFAGTAWHFFFEATEGGTLDNAPLGQRLADAWFQSVTYRTAGFNTVELSELRPASLLFAVVLMFIGASPVSTGGGVKTVSVALAWLAVAGILRGRSQVEAFGRSIPDEVVKRALAVISIGVAVLFFVSLLLAAFEDDSNIPLIELIYEAASACGTVGVTTGITPRLTPPSQIVLMCAMFLGRVGPLTLLLGLAGQRQTVDYTYPDERVTLG